MSFNLSGLNATQNPSASQQKTQQQSNAQANSQTDAQKQKTEGIVYNETSGVYPELKPGSTPGGPQNWDPASQQQLHDARTHIAEVANDGSRPLAPPSLPDQKGLTPNGKAQLADVQSAVADANGKKSPDQFVIAPSKDGGKSPDQSAIKLAPWTKQTDKITVVNGPFRVPTKVGDVPAGNNTYIFFYTGGK